MHRETICILAGSTQSKTLLFPSAVIIIGAMSLLGDRCAVLASIITDSALIKS